MEKQLKEKEDQLMNLQVKNETKTEKLRLLEEAVKSMTEKENHNGKKHRLEHRSQKDIIKEYKNLC